MHPSRGGSAMNNVSLADASGQQPLCEKKDYCDSANTDSGFLSGHNLNTSENIVVEERSHPDEQPANSGTAYRSASSAKQTIESGSNVDSGMIADEELESRDLGLTDICERFDRLMKRDWMKSFQQDEMGETQLHLAVYERNEDTISKLIANLPRPFLNIQNDDAQTALHLAVLTDQGSKGFDVTKQTSATTHCKTCVHLAAEAGSIEAIRSLIDAGANINAREGKSGMSPLHISIEKGNEELANFLLDECPLLSLETTTYAGMTAYQLALLQDKRILISDLTKRGAEQISLPESDADTDSEDEMISNYYGASAFSTSFPGLSAINVS